MTRVADDNRLRAVGHVRVQTLIGVFAAACLASVATHAAETVPTDLIAVQLNLAETNEALQAEPGEHRLASGKRIVKLDSGMVLTRAEWKNAETSSADCHSLETLLASLDQPPRPDSHRSDSVDVEGFPDALTALRMEREVLRDPRYACLSTKLGNLPEDARATLLKVVLESAATNLETQFQIALDAARRVEPLVRGETFASQAFWLDDMDAKIRKCSTYSAHPAAAFAFCTALRLAGDLHCSPLHDQIKQYADRAATERATLAALSTNTSLTNCVAAYSVDFPKTLESALEGTRPLK